MRNDGRVETCMVMRLKGVCAAATDEFLANDVRTKKDGDALGCYGDLGWCACPPCLYCSETENWGERACAEN